MTQFCFGKFSQHSSVLHFGAEKKPFSFLRLSADLALHALIVDLNGSTSGLQNLPGVIFTVRFGVINLSDLPGEGNWGVYIGPAA